MTIENIDLDININDNSAAEFANDILNELITLRDLMNISAMSEYQLVLQGKHQMLSDIIDYIEYVKPKI